jgi:hypothetical protein
MTRTPAPGNGREDLLEASIAAVAAADRAEPGPHPAPEELEAYHRGELPADQQARLHRHLIRCPGCTEEVLDLDAFPDLPLRRRDLDPDASHEQDWRAISARLGIDPAERSAAAGAFAWQLLAAALALAVVGLGWWAASLRSRVGELSAPRANVYVHDLLPVAEGALRTPGGEDRLEIPAGTEHVVLILNLADLGRHSDFRIELRDEQGRVLWRRERLQRAPEGSLSFEVARELLPPGRYHIDLYGLGDAGAAPLVAYRLRVEPPASPGS